MLDTLQGDPAIRPRFQIFGLKPKIINSAYERKLMMRILLADHHTSALWALRTMLQEEPEFEMVGEAVDAESLINLSIKQAPHLVLIDRELPGSPIDELIANLHQLDPKPIVIVMSSDPECSRMMLKAGSDAFISKGDQPDWLLRSLRKYSTHINKKEKTASNDEP